MNPSCVPKFYDIRNFVHDQILRSVTLLNSAGSALDDVSFDVSSVFITFFFDHLFAHLPPLALSHIFPFSHSFSIVATSIV